MHKHSVATVYTYGLQEQFCWTLKRGPTDTGVYLEGAQAYDMFQVFEWDFIVSLIKQV